MDEHKVLITTSGLGSRLGEITNFTNKSLVRIGKAAAISRIIEQYPEGTDFVITLGHFGTQVKDFLEITYKNLNFEFVFVDKFEGPGSSLGRSILSAKHVLQCPFIFHACDTILQEEIPINCNHNWVAGSEVADASHYRTLMVEDNHLLQINEKGNLHFDLSYIGLCKIYDYEKFWSHLENSDLSNVELSDCHVINRMIQESECTFKLVKIEEWLDIGNAAALTRARQKINDCQFDVLDKLEESIFFIENKVIKFFYDEKICKNRVERATILSGLVPEILDSRPNFYVYETQEGELFSKSANTESFKEFLRWCKENLWEKAMPEPKVFSSQCEDFYFKKTLMRIDKYIAETGQSDTQNVINGVIIPSAKELMRNLDKAWLLNGVPVRFHGDLILDNVLQTKDGFCLLDWRQDFAGNLEIGDIYYDLAKLNHNLIFNHHLVSRGLYTVERKNDDYTCEILCNSRLMECQAELFKFLDENQLDKQKVQALTAIVWINMAPLHEYPLDRFLFNFGKYNLSKALK